MNKAEITNKEIIIGLLGMVLTIIGFAGMFISVLWSITHNWENLPYWWLSIPPFIIGVIIFEWTNKKIEIHI